MDDGTCYFCKCRVEATVSIKNSDGLLTVSGKKIVGKVWKYIPQNEQACLDCYLEEVVKSVIEKRKASG